MKKQFSGIPVVYERSSIPSGHSLFGILGIESLNAEEVITERNNKILNMPQIIWVKVACTSGPIFEKIMKRYPIFSLQIIKCQIDLMHK